MFTHVKLILCLIRHTSNIKEKGKKCTEPLLALITTCTLKGFEANIDDTKNTKLVNVSTVSYRQAIQ